MYLLKITVIAGSIAASETGRELEQKADEDEEEQNFHFKKPKTRYICVLLDEIFPLVIKISNENFDGNSYELRIVKRKFKFNMKTIFIVKSFGSFVSYPFLMWQI